MMQNISKYLLALLAFAFFYSCEDDFNDPIEEQVFSSGDADFSNYVAIGNSLTSGYANSALYKSAQMESYPNTLATLFQAAGGGAFKQPLMDEFGGFLKADGSLLVVNGSPYNQHLGLYNVNGELEVDTIAGGPNVKYTDNIFNSTDPNFPSGPYNNMGVPGAKSYHLLAENYGNPAGVEAGLANPFFARMASSPAASVFEDALNFTTDGEDKVTFFTMWIGNNDVLAYATSGGIGEDQTGNMAPETYGSNDISDPSVVAFSIQQMLEPLVNIKQAKGVIANVPDVTSIPFFTTISWNALDPADPAFAAQIPTLNQLYGGLNQAFTILGVPERSIVFSEDEPNGVVVSDETLPNVQAGLQAILSLSPNPQIAALAPVLAARYGQARQATAEELILLTSGTGGVNEAEKAFLQSIGVPEADAIALSVNGVTLPLTDEDFLRGEERNAIAVATATINAHIEALADAYNIAFFDANAAMQQLQSGLVYNGTSYSATFVSGNAFSLDGVHPNGRGYAIIANLMAEVIEQHYGARLGRVNPNNFSGVPTAF